MTKRTEVLEENLITASFCPSQIYEKCPGLNSEKLATNCLTYGLDSL
jgi:hypothetical protein